MTTTTGTQETVVQIQKSEEVQGRNGLQWQLTVRWPWTNPDPKFTDTVYLEQKDVAKQPPPGTFNVLVSRRSLKKSKGTPHDGGQDWMWNYYINKFLSQAEAMPVSNGNAPQTGSQDDYRRSKGEMRWTEALHLAVTFSHESPEVVLENARWFYEQLCNPPEPNGDGNLWHETEEPEMPPPPEEAPDDIDDLPF